MEDKKSKKCCCCFKRGETLTHVGANTIYATRNHFNSNTIQIGELICNKCRCAVKRSDSQHSTDSDSRNSMNNTVPIKIDSLGNFSKIWSELTMYLFCSCLRLRNGNDSVI